LHISHTPQEAVHVDGVEVSAETPPIEVDTKAMKCITETLHLHYLKLKFLELRGYTITTETRILIHVPDA
jgi:hypothetical protein